MANNNIATVIYCNLNRTRVAHDMFDCIGEDIGAQVFCCSEPNQTIAKTKKEWRVDDKHDIAQWTTEEGCSNAGRGKGFVWMEYHGIVIYTCYISPNVPINEYDDFLNGLDNSIGSQNTEVLVLGDFNAWATPWGSRTTNVRGERVLEWMDRRRLVLLNDGGTPTFVKGEMEAFIDLTFCSSKLAGRIRYWRVMEEVDCASDHIPIQVQINLNKRHGIAKAAPIRLKKFKESHRTPLIDYIDQRATSGVEEFMEVVNQGCKAVIGLTSAEHHHPPKYWWNDEIASLRYECIKARRAITRANRRGSIADAERERLGAYQRLTAKRLRSAIKVSKQTCWETEITKLNINPWGTAFRISTGKMKKRSKVDLPTQMKVVADLFPIHEAAQYDKLPEHDLPNVFTMEELWSAVGKIKTGKAPGPNGLSPEVTRAVCLHFPDRCLSMFNDCLTHGEFPAIWKRANLMVIPKPKKNRNDPQTYRPICLIDTMGKVLEHLLQRRLREEMGVNLSENQFGYRQGKSTVDALKKVFEFGKSAKSEGKYAVLMALDIKNAFNSASWEKIDEALDRMNTPAYLREMTRSYLSNRSIIVEGEEIAVTSGVPQGSVLGPLLWCVLYNEVLEMELGPDAQLSCYADDLAVLVAGKTTAKVTGRANRVASEVVDKLSSLGLTIATDKTEIVMLSSKRKTREVAFKIKDKDVSSIESAKYLGVWVSRDLNLGRHMNETASKADKAALALSSLMPNRGGPSPGTRRMFARGVYAICLYAAPAWFEAISAKKQLGDLERSTRRILLRVCCGYRSLSGPAAEVIAGIPPTRLLAKEKFLLFQGEERGGVERGTRTEWSECWATETRAAWTRRLIPSIDAWMDRRHGEVNSDLCQFLSGHGAFRAHLLKLNVCSTDQCMFCYERDTVEHAFFCCRRFRWMRGVLERTLGEILAPDTVVELMCREEGKWRAVAEYVAKVVEMRGVEESLQRK